MLNNKHKINYYSTIRSLKAKEKKIIKQVLHTQKNPEFLFSIIITEKMNRGKVLYLEKILSVFLPKIIISLDLSLGICQIKPATAKQILNVTDSLILELLINTESNIAIMCKLISYYNEKLETKEEVLNYYLTGKKKPSMNNELEVYQQLVIWSTINNLYLKFIQNAV